MKIDFESHFSPNILDRGLGYYENGRIEGITIKNDQVKTIVSGSHDYNVSAKISNSKFVSATCNCPYAKDTGDCKHVAALLYYINNKKIDLSQLKKDSEATSRSTKNIIAQIPDRDLRDFVFELISDNESAKRDFRLKFSELLPTPSAQNYKREIKKAIHQISGKNGFITYDLAWTYAEEMQVFIDEATLLVTKQHHDTAFNIISAILDEIPDLAIDDSDGVTSDVSESCAEIIVRILDSCSLNHPIIKKIFDYITTELKTERLSNYGVEIGDLIRYFIDKKLFLDATESCLLSVIHNKKHQKYAYTYHDIESLISLYEATNQPDKILSLIQDNLQDYNVLLRYIDIKLGEKDIPAATQLLRDGIQQHVQYAGIVSELTNKLLEIQQSS